MDIKLNKRVSIVVAVICLALSGCASQLSLVSNSGENLVGVDGVVTLVNLHPDMRKAPRLTAINWQMPALIPMCTKVKILEVNKKRATFVDESTGVTYMYFNHRSAGEPFNNHLQRFFGKTCDQAKVAKMSKVDRDGIKAGKIKKGMTKQGVIYAAGYPPKHQTPSTNLDTWRYWKNRWDTIVINFSNGKVSQVID